MLLAFIKIDEIFIPLSCEDMLDMVSSKINLILNYTLSHLIIIVFNWHLFMLFLYVIYLCTRGIDQTKSLLKADMCRVIVDMTWITKYMCCSCSFWLVMTKIISYISLRITHTLSFSWRRKSCICCLNSCLNLVKCLDCQRMFNCFC